MRENRALCEQVHGKGVEGAGNPKKSYKTKVTPRGKVRRVQALTRWKEPDGSTTYNDGRETVGRKAPALPQKGTIRWKVTEATRKTAKHGITPENVMMCEGIFAGTRCSVVFDTGSSINCISREFAELQKLDILKYEKPVKICSISSREDVRIEEYIEETLEMDVTIQDQTITVYLDNAEVINDLAEDVLVGWSATKEAMANHYLDIEREDWRLIPKETVMIRNCQRTKIRREPQQRQVGAETKDRSSVPLQKLDKDEERCRLAPESVRIQLKDPNCGTVRKWNPRFNRQQEEALRELERTLLEGGYIEPSRSEWNSPVRLVPKDGGRYRLCINYIEVNKAIMGDAYPLPKMVDSLQKVKGAKWFAKVDLKNGYWNVPIKEGRELTAFEINGNKYQWTVLPQGIAIGPSIFHRYMEKVMRGLEAFNYFDDILVWGNTREEVKVKVKTVTKRLEEYKLTINKEKSQMEPVTELVICGYLVSRKGITIPEDKIEHLTTTERPSKQKDLRKFLGKLQHHRKMLPGLAAATKPLWDQLRDYNQNNKIIWTQELRDAWGRVRELLKQPMHLCLDYDIADCTLYTDAANTSVAGVLKTSDGLLVDSWSRTLNETERKWNMWEKEFLAVYESLLRFGHLYGSETINIMCDNSTVIARVKDMKIESRKEAKWQELIARYKTNIQFIASKDNPADRPSREVTTQEVFDNAAQTIASKHGLTVDNARAILDMLVQQGVDTKGGNETDGRVNKPDKVVDKQSGDQSSIRDRPRTKELAGRPIVYMPKGREEV